MYSEHGSKNRNGVFYQLGIDNKCVSIYRNEQAGERCVFSLLDKYISKLPEEALLSSITIIILRKMVLGTLDNREESTY